MLLLNQVQGVFQIYCFHLFALDFNPFLPKCSLFDPPENLKKPKVFQCLQGDQKGTLVRKGLTRFRPMFPFYTP